MKVCHWVSDVLHFNGLWCITLHGQAIEEEWTSWTAWPLRRRDCDPSETSRITHINAVSNPRRIELSPSCVFYMSAPLYVYLNPTFFIPALDIYKFYEIQISEHFSGKWKDPKAGMKCCALNVTLTGSCTVRQNVITYSRWKIRF